jgi:CheY-like chemotaxis protein
LTLAEVEVSAPDPIVLDIHPPHASGIAITKLLKSNATSNILVLAVTGYVGKAKSTRSAPHSGLAAGFDEVLRSRAGLIAA